MEKTIEKAKELEKYKRNRKMQQKNVIDQYIDQYNR